MCTLCSHNKWGFNLLIQLLITFVHPSFQSVFRLSDRCLWSPHTLNLPSNWSCVTASCLPPLFWVKHFSSVFTSSSVTAKRMNSSSIWQPSAILVTLEKRDRKNFTKVVIWLENRQSQVVLFPCHQGASKYNFTFSWKLYTFFKDKGGEKCTFVLPAELVHPDMMTPLIGRWPTMWP